MRINKIFQHLVLVILALMGANAHCEEYRAIMIKKSDVEQVKQIGIAAIDPTARTDIGYVQLPPSRSLPNTTPSTMELLVVITNSAGQCCLANWNVRLTPQRRPNSHGHDHDDASRPLGELSRTTGSTGADGYQFTYTYTAPEVSGLVDLRVECWNDFATCPPDDYFQVVDVQVPGMMPLTQGLDYNLVGSYGMPGVTSQHIGNHYGTPGFLVKVRYLAALYNLKFNSKLDYNDLSLIYGGRFDIYNNWRGSHHEHKVGTNIDVRYVPVTNRREFLVMLARADINGEVLDEPDSRHLHIRD